jgi:hypothetical protein
MTFGPEYRPEDGGIDEVDFSGPARVERHRGRLLSLVGVAIIGLGGGGGIAYAAEHSGSTPPAATSASHSKKPDAQKPFMPVKWRRGVFSKRFRMGLVGPFGGFAFGAFGGAVHGQITERKAGGGFQTVDIQQGKVTAVSSSSITIKSADGYTATYGVAKSTEVNAQAAGIATVKAGNRVFLVATVTGGKATAASIIDITSIKSSHAAFGFPFGPPQKAPAKSQS